MNECIDFRVVIFYNDKNKISASECLNDMKFLSESVNELNESDKIWLLTGYSRKQASKYYFCDENGFSDMAIKTFDKSSKEVFPSMMEVIWDGGEDDFHDNGITYNRLVLFPGSGYLSVELSLNVPHARVSFFNMLALINKLTLLRNTTAIEVHSGESYDKRMFPDRLSFGWMYYINKVLTKEQVPEAFSIEPIYKENNQIGSVIISVDGIYDGYNSEHINKSNDIAARLVDLGVLPITVSLSNKSGHYT